MLPQHRGAELHRSGSRWGWLQQLALGRVWWVGREGLGHPAPLLSPTSAGGGLLAEVMADCLVLSVFSNTSVIQRPTAKGNGIPY